MLYDLEASGLSEWTDPHTAGQAAAESQKRVLAGLISLRLVLANELWEEKDRSACRKLERALDDAQKTGTLLSSLLNAEKWA